MGLSSPRGQSVDDAISQERSSIAYTSIDDAARFIHHLGKGCQLDLQEAYRAVPIHPSDQLLLAVKWDDIVYMDRALPFGLRSAPKLFSALTDGLMWLLHSSGVRHGLHYLDDFLLLGPANSLECTTALDVTLAMCEHVGFPIAPGKTEGPTTQLTFLGIVIDTIANQLRLPQDELQNVQQTIESWMCQGRRNSTW